MAEHPPHTDVTIPETASFTLGGMGPEEEGVEEKVASADAPPPDTDESLNRTVVAGNEGDGNFDVVIEKSEISTYMNPDQNPYSGFGTLTQEAAQKAAREGITTEEARVAVHNETQAAEAAKEAEEARIAEITDNEAVLASQKHASELRTAEIEQQNIVHVINEGAARTAPKHTLAQGLGLEASPDAADADPLLAKGAAPEKPAFEKAVFGDEPLTDMEKGAVAGGAVVASTGPVVFSDGPVVETGHMVQEGAGLQGAQTDHLASLERMGIPLQEVLPAGHAMAGGDVSHDPAATADMVTFGYWQSPAQLPDVRVTAQLASGQTAETGVI